MPPVPGVLDGVVQQDHHQPAELSLVPCAETGRGRCRLLQRHAQPQRPPTRRGADSPVATSLMAVSARAGRLAGGVADLARKSRSSTSSFIRVRLVLGVAASTLDWRGHRVLRVGQDDAGVGQNDGEGGFELVGGVGHKLALLLPGPLHRAQGHGGEDRGSRGRDPTSAPAPTSRDGEGQIDAGYAVSQPQIGKGDAELAAGLCAPPESAGAGCLSTP